MVDVQSRMRHTIHMQKKPQCDTPVNDSELKIGSLTMTQLIAARDALVPRLKKEQRADWYDVRHRYNALANEIAYRLAQSPLDPTAVLRSKLAQIYALSQRLETHVHALPPGSMDLIYRIGKLATQCPECDDSGIVADEETSKVCERCSLTRLG